MPAKKNPSPRPSRVNLKVATKSRKQPASKKKTKTTKAKAKAKAKGKRKSIRHPPYKVMVHEAIKELRSPRKGASAQAILKFIAQTYRIEAPNQIFLRTVLRRGVEDGTLKKEKASYKIGKALSKSKRTKKVKKDSTKKKTEKETKPKSKAKAKKPKTKATAKAETKTTTKRKRGSGTQPTEEVSGNTAAVATPAPASSASSATGASSSSGTQSESQPKKSRRGGSGSVKGMPEEDDLRDVFAEFFEDLATYRQQHSSPWNTPEARDQRFQARKELWERELPQPIRSFQVVDYNPLLTLNNDARRQQVRGLRSFLLHSADLDAKITIHRGTIYHLNVDAVVNATDANLSGGGGLDAAIHDAAGRVLLSEEIRLLSGCPEGSSEITRGYHLPARFIVHSVGPRDSDARKLATCYISALDLATFYGARSIAFPCIATGSFGFPIEASAQIALQTVRHWLETNDNATKIDRIVFVMFREQEERAYYHYVSSVFPPPAAVPVRQLVRTNSLDRREECAVRQNVELMDQWLPRGRNA